MIHLFILFPMLLILGAIMFQLRRNNPQEVTYYYFRNFIIIWSICTVAIGAAETFFHTEYAVLTALSIALPFLYVASANLVKLPFALYNKKGMLPNFLAGLVVILGISYGVVIFLNINNLIDKLGPLQGIFSFLASNAFQIHIWTILIIFSLVALFFLYGAVKSPNWSGRIRQVLVGTGLLVAAIAERVHVLEFHAAGKDFYIILGFVLIIAGLFYPLLVKESSPQTT